MAGASDPPDECLTAERPSPYRPLLRVRTTGVGAAWLAAVRSGWTSLQAVNQSRDRHERDHGPTDGNASGRARCGVRI
jgi:hypothetical protein